MYLNCANFNPGIMKYNDIRPLFAGLEQCRANHSYGPAIRHHCVIHYCVSGKGMFRNTSGTYEVNAGQIFIINPDELTYYQADSADPWKYVWIAFSGNICEKVSKLKPVITLENTDVFSDIEKALRDGILRPEHYLILLLRLFEQLLPIDPSSMPGYALRTKEYIRLHFMEDISIEKIAESFNIDRRYLLRLFKREFGITIVNYLVKTRLEAAYEYLREGYAVNRAAVMCGYCDAYNFSKMFKKYYGISPSEVAHGNRSIGFSDCDFE